MTDLHEETSGPPGDAHERSAPAEWHTWGGALRLVFSFQLLCRTMIIALIVGTILSLINQAHIIAAGDADAATWARVVANFIVPFIVSNVGALSATRT
jgi:hypothetical protein